MELSKKLTPEWVKIEHAGETLEFLCAPLKGSQFLNIGALIGEERIGEAAMAAARASVRDWRGFVRDGEPVPFSRSELELLDTVEAAGLLVNLMGRILERSKLTDAERKN